MSAHPDAPDIPEAKFALPKTFLSSKDEADSVISYYIAPRYQLISASFPLLQYCAGALHMLDMLCVQGSEAEKSVREVKESVGTLINAKIAHDSQIYAVLMAEHTAIKAGVNPYSSKKSPV